MATTSIQQYIILFVFIAWGSIFLSHKIAGPLYRFQKTLLDIQNGNLNSRIALRKLDEAKTVAEDFNHTIAYLDAKMQRLKSIVQQHENNPQQLVAQLKDELSKIKTSGD